MVYKGHKFPTLFLGCVSPGKAFHSGSWKTSIPGSPILRRSQVHLFTRIGCRRSKRWFWQQGKWNGYKKTLSVRAEMSWEVQHRQTQREAAGRGNREQERGGNATCPRVNRENWARTNWGGNAEDRTRKNRVWRVSGGNWGGSDQHVFTQSLNPAARGLFPLL